MDINLRSRTATFLFPVSLALVLLGLGLSFLTFQNVKRQRDMVDESLFLASQAILGNIELHLQRQLRLHIPHKGRHGARPAVNPEPYLKAALADLVQNDAITVLALYNDKGEVILSAQSQSKFSLPVLNPDILSALQQRKKWSAMYTVEGKQVYMAGKVIKPGLQRLCNFDPAFAGEKGPGGPYLIIGIDPATPLQAYTESKRTALWQAVYVLLVALFIWGLGIAYMRRKDQSRALHRLERFHSCLLDTMPDGLITLGDTGVIQAANPAACRLLGEGKSLVGIEWDSLAVSNETCAVAKDLLSTEAGQQEWVQLEAHGYNLEILAVPNLGQDDNEAEGDSHVTTAETGLLLLIRDRTKIKALEEDLSTAQRLAAVGRLAAGLAHEIRNPLSAIRGFAQLFRKKMAGAEPESQYADIMVREADRLDKVITDLLYLSSPRKPEYSTVDLAELARDLQHMLQFDLKEVGASLSCHIQAITLKADKDMLYQALLNLLLNAVNAVRETPEKQISLESFENENTVTIVVKDTGTGMTEEAKKHALEPFFTTRHQGTGLGLAMVHRIVCDHRGQMEVLSQKDKGTEVRLIFANPSYKA